MEGIAIFDRLLPKKNTKCIYPLFLPTLIAMLVICISPSLLAQYNDSCPLVEEILAFFPTVEGYIVDVKGDKIYLDLGEKSGVKKGMEFLCIREGEAFTHPITGVVLGHFEDKLGFIQISEISENYSIGKILETFSGKSIQRGDKIRISTAKIPIAFPPASTTDPRFTTLIDGLNQTGRFIIVPEGRIVSALHELGQSGFEGLTRSQTKEFAAKLDLAAIILPSLDTVDTLNRKNMIHIRIISAQTGVLLTEISHECGSEKSLGIAKPAAVSPPAEIKPQSISQGIPDIPEKFRVRPQGGITDISHISQELPFSISLMAIGDVTGNGDQEVCVTDGQNIFLYSWQKDRLQLMTEVRGHVSQMHLSLDIADINQNGRAEIFVSNMEKDSLKSFVLEWQQEGLKKIWEKVPLFLRVISIYPGKKIFLGQPMGISSPFGTPITELRWENDAFTSMNEMTFPPKVNIFNLAMADMNDDGTEELIFLDERLRIYQKGKQIWKSDSNYGERNHFFEFQPKGAVIFNAEDTRVYLPSRFIIGDMNGNGRPDIMLIKNVSSTGRLFPRSQLFRKGEACLIEWNGISFAEVWCSGEIDAYLTDIGIGDINFDHNNDLILSMVLISGIGKFWEKSPSKILFY